jgi:hypothetical protein
MHPGLAALNFPHSIIAPWARCDGPSLAQRSSRGILPLNPLRNDCVRPAERGVCPGADGWVWRGRVVAIRRVYSPQAVHQRLADCSLRS